MSPTDRPKPPRTGPAPDVPDPEDPPNEEELRAAEALRRELEGATLEKSDHEAKSRRGAPSIDPQPNAGTTIDVRDARAAAEFAESLRAAVSPREISPERHRQILDRALSPDRAAVASSSRTFSALHTAGASGSSASARGAEALLRPKSKITYLAWGGAAGLLAMAAAIALVIRGSAPEDSLVVAASAQRAPSLAMSRSAADLFPEGIPRSGGTSDRVDRIAYARAQDFRHNQFARWGAQ